MLHKISSTQGRYGADILNDSKNALKTNDFSKKIIVANKGESGYLPGMDIDYDGIVTLDEFNQYCEEKGIDGKEKTKLFLTIMLKGNDEKIVENEQGKENDNIYAKKGDKKYNEKMDENKDSIITHDEYLKYCQKNKEATEEKETTEKVPYEFKKAIEAYKPQELQEPIITVEGIA